MATITLKGNEIHTNGTLPEIGQKAPDFELVSGDLSISKLSDYKGTRVILNVFPSIDTGICAASARTFNKEASSLNNTKVLCVSRDLPFAQGRFCAAEGLEDVINLSDFKTGQFGKDYGLEIIDGPMQGLHSRAVVILDEEGSVLYTEQIPEIVQEPDYTAALKILS
ncbi:thiol peroxidase [Aquimarina gracilis]|uniref:Thiol peroxidase n=1 Tax=Aquimarina gracilis TaxID=874422 RepID=A0ABU5ZW35_9FLAO|nr:thiol peroxidase [Aquimarina gracilis]MEB3346065.1 thiol peroxidase [Aquimarina gracilis]